ncbi:hypothetical protein FRC14_000027 [Serendipita sp. 396]|nr:hypothetical protein FRC14_000027 [Serendipita sp. 396]KAG8789893.1 hypothetical protein FRC15_000085 [Serendipita sp. 397]KAG8879436.1 hypothetical protein FRC20_000008 [Serendipita sp. 405]
MASPGASIANIDTQLDFDIQLTSPRFYGHKPLHPEDTHSKAVSTSAQIQRNLMTYSQSNPRLQAALSAIFSDLSWNLQTIPVPHQLLRNDALRVKVKDEQGNDWWPCQLGCPDGIPYCIRGTKTPIRQATKATSHVEWHLGLRRYACYVCAKTFTAKQELERHQNTHNESRVQLPCPNGCGRTFVDQDRVTNINRHLNDRCPNA